LTSASAINAGFSIDFAAFVRFAPLHTGCVRKFFENIQGISLTVA
jgi:hypothetical protein